MHDTQVAGELIDKCARSRHIWEANSIAIVGASDDPYRIGGRPIAYMLERKYAGQILPVNPNRDVVQGLRCYRSIAELPYTPDTAIIAVANKLVAESVESLGKIGVKSAIVFSSGFAETGAEGRSLQAELTRIANSYGVRIVGPNTLGFYDLRRGLFATFSSAFESNWPLPGTIGIASQSGAFAAHIFSSARKRGIGIPLCITTGNESDVSLGEVVLYMINDSTIDVIGIYLEGLSDVNSFLSALQLAKEKRKPIVLMKTGRSAVGRDAAESHTASIAGDDAVFNAVLKEFAVVRAYGPDEFLDIAYVATKKIYPENNTLGVLSISGGAGILISDLAEDLDLSMPELWKEHQNDLKRILPFASVKNPVDCTAQVINEPQIVEQFLTSMMEGGQYESVLAFFTQAGGTASIEASLRPRLAKVRNQYPGKLFVMSIIASDEVIGRYEQDGFCVFEDPARAVRAIHAMGIFGAAFERRDQRVAASRKPDLILNKALNEAQSMEVLAAIGLTPVPAIIVNSASAAAEAAQKIGFPVVMKILSADIKHKSEMGGVILNVNGSVNASDSYELLIQRAAEKAPTAKIAGVLVCKHIANAVECIMGIRNDPTFGPIAMFGLGGVFVEILQDVVFRRCPFNQELAKEMILSIRGAPILLGTRGKKHVDIDDLAEKLSRLSIFAVEAGAQITSVEANPIFAIPGGSGCYVADALIELDEGESQCRLP